MSVGEKAARPAWATRIREERNARGWSVAKAASRLRDRDPRLPDTQTLAKYWAQRWESGRIKPGDRYRHHLCVLLGISLDLFDDEDTGAPIVPYLHFGTLTSLSRESTRAGEELIMTAARESADYGRRHGKSNVHPSTLEQLGVDVRELSVDALSSEPLPVVLRARTLRDQTFDLLDGQQWPQHRREMFLLAGQLCGILAVASGDFFGRYDAAATQCRTAWLCAEMADHNELRSWIRSLQSGVSFWAGRWKEAASYAQQASFHAESASSAMRAAALQARAFARLHDRDEVERAVAESESARRLPTSDVAVGVMDFSEGNRVRCIGTAFLWLGDHDAANRYLEQALDFYEQISPSPYAHVTVIRMDLATARLAVGDIQGASQVLQPVFEMAPQRRLAGAARRTTDLLSLLMRTEAKNSPAAVDLCANLEQFRSEVSVLITD
jgi:transcriptional regulator with XRE-family HTH domain